MALNKSIIYIIESLFILYLLLIHSLSFDYKNFNKSDAKNESECVKQYVKQNTTLEPFFVSQYSEDSNESITTPNYFITINTSIHQNTRQTTTSKPQLPTKSTETTEQSNQSLQLNITSESSKTFISYGPKQKQIKLEKKNKSFVFLSAYLFYISYEVILSIFGHFLKHDNRAIEPLIRSMSLHLRVADILILIVRIPFIIIYFCQLIAYRFVYQKLIKSKSFDSLSEELNGKTKDLLKIYRMTIRFVGFSDFSVELKFISEPCYHL